MTVVWNDKKVIDAIDRNVELAERRIAAMVTAAAKANAPKRTGTLRVEIAMKKSKFKGGGYIVQAQGPGNYTRYYASFVELGTHDTAAQPYLRPATNRYKTIGQAMLKRAIK